MKPLSFLDSSKETSFNRFPRASEVSLEAWCRGGIWYAC